MSDPTAVLSFLSRFRTFDVRCPFWSCENVAPAHRAISKFFKRQRLTVRYDRGILVAAIYPIMPAAIKELRFLTLEQAAEILQVSKRTLQRLIQRGQMPSLKIGGQWRIPETQFLKWVEDKLIPLSDYRREDDSKRMRGKNSSTPSAL